MDYEWSWSVFNEISTDNVNTYFENFVIGAGWTFSLAFLSIFFALQVGALVTLMRLGSIRALNRLASAYIEVFRNIPIIVQIFIWYFVVPELLPQEIGMKIKQMPQPWASFIPALLCLAFYGGGRMSEVLRAGIQSLPRGQYQAAIAIGLTELQAFRYVVIPQAIRIVIPALTSEFVSAVKYSSVAFTIGLLEVTSQAKIMQEYTFRIFEAFAFAAAIYVVINYTIIFGMRSVERKFAIPGLIGSLPDNMR